jgi:hypothetical protein
VTDPILAAQLQSLGGKVVPTPQGVYAAPGTEVWDFGYLSEPMRTPEEDGFEKAIIREMPRFHIAGNPFKDVDKAFLWDAAKKVNDGKHFLTFRQETGSCVGNGLGQATRILAACDAILRNEPEDGKKFMFWMFPYGWSRFFMGARGKGEGSTGGSAAKAAREKGFPDADLPGLPKYNTNDGISYGGRTESDWSYGPSQPRGEWDSNALKHLIKTTAQARSADDVREGLKNGYPATCASMWGGQMRPAVQDGVLLNKRVTQWAHQMCIIGWWNHPTLGEIFYVLNSWGPDTHGTDPAGGPPGGFWVKKSDVDYMCNDEVFILSQWDGFPAQELSWFI